MTQYFVLDYEGGTRGVPVYVDGLVQEYFENSWNDFAPGAEVHYQNRTPLNLRTKHRLIDFDYSHVQSLFVASDVLIDRLDQAACEIVTRPLRVWESKSKLVTRKSYFLLRVQDRLWAMDTDQSEYRVNRDPQTGAIRYSKWAPDERTYTNVFKLIIDASRTRGRDLFYCAEAFRHIVSERLMPRLSGLKGVKLTPTAEYVFPLVGEKIVDRG